MIIKYSKAIDLRKFKRDNDWRIDIASKQKAIAQHLITATGEIYCCPICDSSESTFFVSIYEYPYHECLTCGHLYSKCPPNPESLALLYTEDNKGNVLSAQADIYLQQDLFQRRVDEIAQPKVQFVSEIIKSTGKWIDIGAGVGDLVLAAERFGWDAFGYESDKQEVEFAKLMGSKVENLLLTPLNMDIIESASIVSTINVLEHISNPKGLVKAIADNMKAGSYFLFEVPRFPSISSVANKCFPELAARNIYSPDHLHLFSDRSAALMLGQANLEVIATWFFGQDIYEIFGNIFVKGNFSNHTLVDQTLQITNQLQEIVDRNGLADTMLVLTRKN